ncbi:hypothetical protein Ocin01_02242 [Orchesella cincta]|uniref:Uncharacterized protein n=1 Tax=Orchesella cincta TaxID=48709 RepID=A0A1D2NGN2_ORCCI|nr:hypothetical protein Ocin01_02242 [Orchesella cincta]
MGKFLIFTLVVIVAIVGQSNAEEKKIGKLMECDHSLKGDVWGPHAATHDKKHEVRWGRAGVVVFHAEQPDPCEIFLWGVNKNETNTEVEVHLPDPISSYGAITVFCHAFCNNFGHLLITPEMIEGIEAAPADFKPNVTCTVDKNKFRKTPAESDGGLKECNEENTIKHHKADGSNCNTHDGTTKKGDDGAQFQPSMVMIIVGVLCFGLFSQYVSK